MDSFKDTALAVMYLLSGIAILIIASVCLWRAALDRRKWMALDASMDRRHHEALALREKELGKDVEYARISAELREKELAERQRENDMHQAALELKQRGFE